jgi:hypothetical protein
VSTERFYVTQEIEGEEVIEHTCDTFADAVSKARADVRQGREGVAVTSPPRGILAVYDINGKESFTRKATDEEVASVKSRD